MPHQEAWRLRKAYSPKSVEKRSDNSRKGSLWTLEEAQNGAETAISVPFVEPHTGTRWWQNDLSDSFWKLSEKGFEDGPGVYLARV